MAEQMTPAPAAGSRMIVIAATVVTVVFFTFILLGVRSCSLTGDNSPNAPKVKLSSDVVIYSNLDLKDSAMVIAQLKALRIPYQIKDEGRSIAVPRGRADEARLGLAEKNLPAGGEVGWEIFDQTKLGATDFDRRIQFIRAISGELSRTISRISAVDDARVQIVIPQTQLFQATVAPVTASVLLKLKEGETLTPAQVNGIVYLVANSVENLKPANVTIVDIDGNILSGAAVTVPKKAEVMAPAPEEEEKPVVLPNESEKAALDVQAKLQLEDELTSKVQSLLNRMYPINAVIARVTVNSAKNRRTSVIILVNKDFRISPELKRNTFDTVAAAIGYEKDRGDRIMLKSVLFRSTGQVQPTPAKEEGMSDVMFAKAKDYAKKVYRKVGMYSAIAIIAVPIIILMFLISLIGGGRKESALEAAAAGEEAELGEGGEIPIVEEIKTLAAQRPEVAAEIIRSWTMEGR